MEKLSKNVRERLLVALADNKAGAEFLQLMDELTDEEIRESIAPEKMRYVSKDGDDATATGAFDRPFLTVSAALASITDASVADPVWVIVGPGTFVEPNSFSLPDNVMIKGAGKRATTIKRSDNSSITCQPGVDAKLSAYYHLNFSGGLTITRPSAGVLPNASYTFGMYHCGISGNFTYNGAGIFTPNGNDLLDIRDCTMGNVIAHNVTGGIFYSTLLQTTADEIGTMPTAVAAVVSSDSLLGTVTVAPGTTFAPGTGAPRSGQCVGFGTPSRGFKYASYDINTGVFSGVEPWNSIFAGSPNGSLPASGNTIHNMQSPGLRLVECQHTKFSVKSSVTAAGGPFVAGSVLGGVFPGQGVSLDGVNTEITGDLQGLTTTPSTVNLPIYLNGATSAQLKLKSTANFMRLMTPTAADWATAAPATVEEALNRMSALLKTLNAGNPIP